MRFKLANAKVWLIVLVLSLIVPTSCCAKATWRINHSYITLQRLTMGRDWQAAAKALEAELAWVEKDSSQGARQPGALWLLAKWYHVADMPQHSIPVYKVLLQGNYRKELVAGELARELYRIGDVSQAVDYWALTQACKELNREATELVKVKAWQEALLLSNTGLAVCPYNQEGVIIAAVALHGSGRSVAAISLIDDALKESSSDAADWWLTKARIQEEVGDWDGALASCQSALEVPAAIAGASRCVGRVMLYGRDQPEAAIPWLRQSIELKPDDVWTHITLGDSYLRINNSLDAEAAYQNGAEVAPKSGAPFVWLARLYIRHGKVGHAEVALQEALRREPNSTVGLVEFGRLSLALRQTANAISYLRRAIDLDSGNWEAQRLLAEAYFQAGDSVSALEIFREMLRREPGNNSIREAMIRLGIALDDSK